MAPGTDSLLNCAQTTELPCGHWRARRREGAPAMIGCRSLHGAEDRRCCSWPRERTSRSRQPRQQARPANLTVVVLMRHRKRARLDSIERKGQHRIPCPYRIAHPLFLLYAKSSVGTPQACGPDPCVSGSRSSGQRTASRARSNRPLPRPQCGDSAALLHGQQARKGEGEARSPAQSNLGALDHPVSTTQHDSGKPEWKNLRQDSADEPFNRYPTVTVMSIATPARTPGPVLVVAVSNRRIGQY